MDGKPREPENLYPTQMERWFSLKKDMAETKNETIRLQTLQETTDRYIQALCKQRDFINGKIERMSDTGTKYTNNYTRCSGKAT